MLKSQLDTTVLGLHPKRFCKGDAMDPNIEEIYERADEIVKSSSRGEAPAVTRSELSEEARQELNDEASGMMSALMRILVATAPMLRSVTQGELVVLLAIGMANDEPTPMELSKEVALTRPRITQILDKLDGKGLIVRTRDAHDQRKVHVRLSEAGYEAIIEFTNKMTALLENHLMLLGPEDSRELKRILFRTVDIVNSYDLASSTELLNL